MISKEANLPKDLLGYLGPDKKFNRLPGKRQKRKLDLLIQFLGHQFEENKMYTENEINNILNEFHSFNDPATIRRLLIGTAVLDRSVDGRRYWVKV